MAINLSELKVIMTKNYLMEFIIYSVMRMIFFHK